jgi:hypothetical protein
MLPGPDPIFAGEERLYLPTIFRHACHTGESCQPETRPGILSVTGLILL